MVWTQFYIENKAWCCNCMINFLHNIFFTIAWFKHGLLWIVKQKCNIRIALMQMSEWCICPIMCRKMLLSECRRELPINLLQKQTQNDPHSKLTSTEPCQTTISLFTLYVHTALLMCKKGKNAESCAEFMTYCIMSLWAVYQSRKYIHYKPMGHLNALQSHNLGLLLRVHWFILILIWLWSNMFFKIVLMSM